MTLTTKFSSSVAVAAIISRHSGGDDEEVKEG